DIGLAGLPLGVQRIEFLVQSVLGGFACVDGAAQDFSASTCHWVLGSLSGSFCRRSQPEKPWPVPFGAGDLEGNFGKAGEGPSLPGESLFHDYDPVGPAIPGPHQFGARLDPSRQLNAATELCLSRFHQLIEQALMLTRESAVGYLLNPMR